MKTGVVLIGLTVLLAIVPAIIGDATATAREFQAFTVGAQVTCLLIGIWLTATAK